MPVLQMKIYGLREVICRLQLPSLNLVNLQKGAVDIENSNINKK